MYESVKLGGTYCGDSGLKDLWSIELASRHDYLLTGNPFLSSVAAVTVAYPVQEVGYSGRFHSDFQLPSRYT
jgi:hypothetical protein